VASAVVSTGSADKAAGVSLNIRGTLPKRHNNLRIFDGSDEGLVKVGIATNARRCRDAVCE
jgi:hypothetical protein